jgi:hypothetical protein
MIEAATQQESSSVQTRALQVASSFTARPLAKTLRSYLMAAGIADTVETVEYGHVAEYMLGPACAAENILGTLVLLRLEDSLRDQFKNGVGADGAKLRQQLTLHVDEFVKQVTILATRGKAVLVLPCPSNGWVAESCKLTLLYRGFTNLLVARLRGVPGVTVLSWPKSLAAAEVTDRNTDRLGQIPFTPDAFEQLGKFLGPEIETALANRTVISGASSSNGKADFAKFLAGLEVKVHLAPPGSEGRNHVDRILRTAAAFSLTGENHSLSDQDVDRIIESDGCLLISASDRLSGYGPSGVVTFHADADALVVDALALSCPVLGKQVEYAVISGLGQVARSRGCSKLVFKFRESGRNQIMLKFLNTIADGTPAMAFALRVAEAEERIRKVAVAPGTWTLEFGT